MNIKSIFILLAVWSVIFSSLAQNVQPPTVVFYITDDLGWHDSQIYNPSSQVRTPNLAKLSSQGMLFTNAYIASPACAPSRAALLTGLMPARNGAEENHAYPHDSLPLLHKQLKDNGYEVAAFGKVAHQKMNDICGFDFYDESKAGLAKSVAKYLHNRQSNKPLALFIGDTRPHVPWTDKLVYNPDEIVMPPFLIDTKETRNHRAMYYSDITGIDTEVGNVYELVTKTFGNNSLFLFSSDHGGQWPFGKWNLYDAGTRVPLFFVWPGKIKSGTQTNALVSWIDIMPTLIELTGCGETSKDIDGRSFADVLLNNKNTFRDQIFTTHSGDMKMNVYPIRSVCNQQYKFILNLHPEFYHTNHSDMLRKHGAGEYWNSWDSVAKLDENAKMLIARYYQRPAEEFYDLQNDPGEMNNLILDPKYAKTIDKMRNDLKKWMLAQGDKQTVFRDPYYLYENRPGQEKK